MCVVLGGGGDVGLLPFQDRGLLLFMRASWARSNFVISLILWGFMRCVVSVGSVWRLVGVRGWLGVLVLGGHGSGDCVVVCVGVDGSGGVLVWLVYVGSVVDSSSGYCLV